MKKIILTVGSVTYAIKSKKLLMNNGIAAAPVKLNSSKGGGCQHGIEISYTDFFHAIRILSNNKIAYSVYNGPI